MNPGLTAQQRSAALAVLSDMEPGVEQDVQIARVATDFGEDESAIREEVERLAATPPDRDGPRWPAPLRDEAFHGLPGRFVRVVQPHSEADPAALLASFLVAAGNLFGPGPHVRVESDRHSPRLFVVLAGRTAKARKGTSYGRVRDVVLHAEPAFQNRIVSGLSSGEGLIHAVRDPVEAEGEVVDAGASDKRLLVVESEFASTLKILAREGNILSPILRNAWDTGYLQTLTKHTPMRASGAHISLLAHVTAEEVGRYLQSTEMANGFANRLLWFAVRRARSLPFGGRLTGAEVDGLASDLRYVLENARGIGEVSWSRPAAQLWSEIYPALSEGRPGLIGALLARAEAHTIRIALLYTLFDAADEIRPEHLLAALAVWDYAEASVGYVFQDRLGHPLAEKILHALRQAAPGGLTRTEIHDVDSRHSSRREKDEALELLVRHRLARGVQEPTAGRPRETYYAL